ncbi:hypothetical protein [Inquilinus limosus]|uniref:hypothetical protein n=1 Tax=Inquilinus limosus TaxID=171674 RepID=UPI00126A3C0B|nr:hypothetical protein [Inquilinus limosus]
MIIEIPTAEDFADASLNLLLLAWQIVLGPINRLSAINQEIDSFPDDGGQFLDELHEERNSQMRRMQPSLGNCLTLVQQSIELSIKGRIASVSPYLLIVRDNRESLKIKPGNDILFSDFRTVDATDLFRLHNVVCDSPLNGDFNRFSDEIRRQRNKIMHSAPGNKLIEPKEILLHILKINNELFSDKMWANRVLDHYKKDKYSSLIYGRDFSYGSALEDIDMAIGALAPKDVKKYFAFDRRVRSYICPICLDEVDRKYQRDQVPAFAQLKTKEPNSEYLYCFVCNKNSKVVRRRCLSPGCKSNVISAEHDTAGMCLICCEESE